jgi:hypothetical protein
MEALLPPSSKKLIGISLPTKRYTELNPKGQKNVFQ